MKVLIIADNREVVNNVSSCLQLRWPQTDVIRSNNRAHCIQLLQQEPPELVILDMSIPGIDGIELLDEIRLFSNVPLITLTQKESEMEKITVLEKGADDYVTKPFSAVEFIARAVAVIRRSRGNGSKQDNSVLDYGKLTINLATREVFLSRNRVKLTPIEYSLLATLARNEDKVLSHATLMQSVWGKEYIDDRSFVKKYIYRLRSKLNDDAHNPKMLINQRGIGYKFTKTS